MSTFQQPSTPTEGNACASNRPLRFRWKTPIRLTIGAMLLAGSFGAASSTSATELLPSYPAHTTANAVQQQATTGNAIAGYAMQFLGYPYVWAGNTPAGFDCSGFTQYVVLNTVGIDIGHGTAGQTGYGAYVEWGAWQPGDLVYFAGTYGSGISHAGIYIGDGQFIHAENPSTGVTISSIYSDYYAGHYYGAYRMG